MRVLLGYTVLLCLCATSCGRSADSLGGAALVDRSSPIVLTTPPAWSGTGVVDSAIWDADSGDATVNLRLKTQVIRSLADAATHSVLASGASVLAVDSLEVSGVDYLLVGSIDANEYWILDRFHDVDQDGIPDQSSKTTLLTSGQNVRYITSIFAKSKNEIYLMDQRCMDVLVADGADWVDAIATVPFARSADDDRLKGRTFLNGDTVDGAYVLRADFLPSRGQIGVVNTMPGLEMCDTNSDGIADVFELTGRIDPKPFIFGPELFDGQVDVTVWRRSASVTKTVEIWEVDDVTGADVELLGTLVMTGAESSKTIALASPLSDGEVISFRYSGATAGDQVLRHVVPDWPQVVSVTPDFIDPDTTIAITVAGVNFSSSMTLQLEIDGTATTLPFSFVDSTTVTATFPATPSPELVRVRALAVGQAEEDIYGQAKICVATEGEE